MFVSDVSKWANRIVPLSPPPRPHREAGGDCTSQLADYKQALKARWWERQVAGAGGAAMSRYHCFRRSGLVRMVEAIRAPLMGGLEYMGRIKIFSCDSTLLASSASLQTTVKAPTRSPGETHMDLVVQFSSLTCESKSWFNVLHIMLLSEVPQKYLFKSFRQPVRWI